MSYRLSINDFVPQAVTRAKARQAFEELRHCLKAYADVEIESSSEKPLSMSFLDELIWSLSQSQLLSRTIFVINPRTGEDILHKLARISDFRKLDLTYKDAISGQMKKVQPFSPPTQRLVTLGRK